MGGVETEGDELVVVQAGHPTSPAATNTIIAAVREGRMAAERSRPLRRSGTIMRSIVPRLAVEKVLNRSTSCEGFQQLAARSRANRPLSLWGGCPCGVAGGG